MSAAPMLLTGASTAVGMAGAQAEAAGAQAASNYNATVKGYQADAAAAQAAEDSRRSRIQGKMAIGNIRAGAGASGVQLEGSALDVLEMSASNSEIDALTIKHQGDMKAWAYKAGASLDLLQGQQAREAGNFKAASILISGVSKMIGQVPGGDKAPGGGT